MSATDNLNSLTGETNLLNLFAGGTNDHNFSTGGTRKQDLFVGGTNNLFVGRANNLDISARGTNDSKVIRVRKKLSGECQAVSLWDASSRQERLEYLR